MFPCNADGPRAPALYTYYAIMSLLVVVLAVTLMWIPFVQLITEFNTIIAKVVIYFNVELLGYKSTHFSDALEVLFLSQPSLIVISLCGMSFALYLASNDFLVFAGCYICNLPNTKHLQKLKQIAIAVIEYLLNLTGKRREFTVRNNLMEHHKEHHH